MPMVSRLAVFILATSILVGNQTLAHAQPRFGNPVAVAEQLFPQRSPPVSAPADLKKSSPPAMDQPAPLQAPQAPAAPGPKEPTLDEFGLKPPTRDQLFRVQSEQSLKKRLRDELPKVKQVDFPKDASPAPDVSMTPFPERVVSPIPDLVCYRPLYFEARRTERFGQYVPFIQPLVSAGRFYGDVAILPCRILLTPPWTFECDNR